MPYQDLYNEKSVLQLLAGGSEYAFAQLFDHYRNRIYGVALHLLKLPEPAEEVVQDVFLKIWLKREMLNEIQHFESYLFTMARNTVLDRFKKQAREQLLQQDWKTAETGFRDDADYLLRDKQYAALIQQAVNQLPPQQKQVYMLAKNEGLSQDEIAVRMGISPLTVKKHMLKAGQSVRQHLQEYLHLGLVALLIQILDAQHYF